MTHRLLAGPLRAVSVLCLSLILAGPFASPLAGQALVLKRELPPPVETVPCAGVTAPSEGPDEAGREAAAALVQQAGEAMILGDAARARSLLTGALALNPTSAEIHFQLGRVLAELGEAEAAVEAFCRHVALEPNGPDRAEASRRIEELAPAPPPDPFPPAARAAFETGVRRYDAGDYDEAIREFSRALVELPNWADAHFNRGLAYLAAGRQGAGFSDLQQYLEREPASRQAAAVRARLQEAAPVVVRRSPGVAFAVGLVVPGMGQFYSGRTGMGAFYLLGSGALAAAGVFYTETRVECLLADPGPDGCPREFVVSEEEDRPLLVPALAGAAALTFVGAVHALMSTRGDVQAAAEVAARRVGSGSNALSLRASLPPMMGGAITPDLTFGPQLRGQRTTFGASFNLRF